MNAFAIPAKTVMSKVRPPIDPRKTVGKHLRYMSVTGSKQGAVETENRRKISKTAI